MFGLSVQWFTKLLGDILVQCYVSAGGRLDQSFLALFYMGKGGDLT